MLLQMRGDVRRLVEAGLGALTPSRARGLARSIAQGQPVEQVNRVARELMEWSRGSRERLTEMVSREVRRQLKGLGIATKDDLDALRKRVRELETGRSAAPKTAARSTSKSTSRKRSTAKKSTTATSAASGSSST
jgi:polyhydroxyalkanoate synthesis regulator phasin